MNKQIVIDRSKWKKPSYRGHYDDKAVFYEGISCRCVKCGSSFVFSAFEQQQKFELDGEYPGWLPSLCRVCEENWQAVSIKENEHQATWDKVKSNSRHDLKFLKDWLSILIEAESYRRKGYDHKIGMVKNLLSKMAE